MRQDAIPFSVATPRLKQRMLGVTLVELLVVIAIIGVLIALLLPAVQAARESARRSQCANHLKQAGTALQLHHDAKGAFPPGALLDNACCENLKETFTGWTIEILPYMERDALFQLYNPAKSCGDIANRSFREQHIAEYSCPSDFEPELLLPESGPEGGWTNQDRLNPRLWRTSSYRGMAGRSDGMTIWPLAQYLPTSTSSNAPIPYGWRGPLHAVRVGGQDFVAAGQPNVALKSESFSNITDGTSKTILIGEQTNLYNLRRTFWAYTFGNYIVSQAIPQPRIFSGSFNACTNIPGLPGGPAPCMWSWYSNHPGGMNIQKCDGSGGWINFDIDVFVFSSLGSIAGEEVIENDDL
jgi:type II secretory pathway pseudopilin PulG